MSKVQRLADGNSLRPRALQALWLLIGYYLLVVGLAVASFAIAAAATIPLFLTKSFWFLPLFFLTGLGFGAGLVLLRGILYIGKGADTLPPVSVEAGKEDHPGLWAAVLETADVMGAPHPSTIHLVPDVTAYVTQRGRLLGLIPGPVALTIGMGLIETLRTDQLRSIVAHEFGHITGGDTRLGPLVYRTRETVRKTFKSLRDPRIKWRVAEQATGGLFRAYFRRFMRLTAAVSRQQELAADAGAVRMAGRDLTSSALRSIGLNDAVFDLLLDRYASQLWHAGFWPAELYDGLRALLAEPARRDEFEEVAAELEAREAQPWDSHPGLGDRLHRIATLPEGEPAIDPRPASHLLSDPDRIGQELSRQLAVHATGKTSLRPAGWDVAGQVYGKTATDMAAMLAAAASLAGGDRRRGAVGSTLEVLAADGGTRLAALLEPALNQVPDDRRAELANGILASYLRLAICAELVDRHGASWELSWAEQVTVGGWQGPEPTALALAAVGGEDEAAEVRRALGLPENIQPGASAGGIAGLVAAYLDGAQIVEGMTAPRTGDAEAPAGDRTPTSALVRASQRLTIVEETHRDPTALELRRECWAGNWQVAQTVLAQPHSPDRRHFYVEMCADRRGRPSWLDAWVAAEPEGATPLLVRGAHAIHWAWRARGDKRAEHTSAEAFRIFAERLELAERDLFEAARRAPDDPTPWAYLVLSCRGRQLGLVELLLRFEQVTRRHPLHIQAHRQVLQGLCRKWGGSHEVMFEFARQVARQAPAGSSLPSLVAEAHVERWLDLDPTERAGYFAMPEVLDEIRDAEARSVGHPDYRPPPEIFADHNLFAFCFALADDVPAADHHFQACKNVVTELPWGYLGSEPVSAFTSQRRRVRKALKERSPA